MRVAGLPPPLLFDLNQAIYLLKKNVFSYPIDSPGNCCNKGGVFFPVNEDTVILLKKQAGRDEGLFTNTETGKNPAQQVIGCEFTGDFTQGFLCQA